MLAYRLAKEWGIVDVDAWLETLPYGALDGWQAFDTIEPIGEQRKQTAEIATAIRRLIGVIMANHGVTTTDVRWEDCMPSRFVPEKPIPSQDKPKRPSKKQAKAMFNGLASMFGFGEVVK
jgi:hypothetical protein